MTSFDQLTHLMVRQDQADTPPTCDTGNDYDGRIGLRLAALFIIWVTSSIGATFPIFAQRNKGLRVPEWAFFFCKYFGSGVIIATAFIHLLAPAGDALRDPCLSGTITKYSWVEGIVLMTIVVLFFVELMVMRYGDFGPAPEHEDHGHSHKQKDFNESDHKNEIGLESIPTTTTPYRDNIPSTGNEIIESERTRQRSTHAPGEDHLSHAREHTDIEEANQPFSLEDYKAQMTAIFILEFGIIFHSIFIGLTLAVAGEEFNTLFIVLIFHQTFEGLGLGSRLAVTPWPSKKKWTPYVLGLAYGLSTPVAIGVGLGVRKTYPPGSSTTLIVNGIFDSISAGILIYTGLVELMAHEFMFSNTMRNARIQVVLSAFGLLCLGAGLMALLGKWA